MTLASIARTLRIYATPILLTVAIASVAYLLAAVVYILIQPVERQTALGFRLEFPGADQGYYPNGVKFSGGDIIDTPVLRSVFVSNELERFMSFSDFSKSVVVLEANSTLETLAREYEAKLANPKLSPIERERLEAEYDQKRQSLRKNEYSLVVTSREGLSRVPPTVTAKALSDILRAWADFAANTRQVLLHRVPLISEQAISRLDAANARGSRTELVTSLLALRTASRELRSNIDALSALPGAEVIRSSGRSASLRELELELYQIERSGIEYLLDQVIKGGAIDRTYASALIESQLEYDRRTLLTAEERVKVLRSSFEEYTRESNRNAPDLSANASDKTRTPETQVTPQVSDSFLERVVELAQDAADREYRQHQVDAIQNAALATLPLRGVVLYEEGLLRDLREGSRSGTPLDEAKLYAEHDRITTQLKTIAADLADIRKVLSRSLTASGQMYTITAPAHSVMERGVSLDRLALGAVLTVLLATILAIMGAFIHSRLVEEPSEPSHSTT